MSDEKEKEDLKTQKSMIDLFRETTNSVFSDKNKDTALQIIGSLVNNLKTVVTALDKYLKTKDIDVLAKANELKDKSKSLISPIVEDVKKNGLLDTFKKTGDKIKTKFKDTFKNDTESQGPPTPDEVSQDPKTTSVDPNNPKDSKEEQTTDKTDKPPKSVKDGLSDIFKKVQSKLEDFSKSAKEMAESQKDSSTTLKDLLTKGKETAVGVATKAKDKLTEKIKSVTDKPTDKTKAESQKDSKESKDLKEEQTTDKASTSDTQNTLLYKLSSTLTTIQDKVAEFAKSSKDLAKSQKENTSALKTIAEKGKDKAVDFGAIAKEKAKAAYEKAKERASKRQAEIEEEKASLKKDPKGGKEKGFLGKLLGMLTTGITGAISMAFKGLTMLLGRVIGPLIGKGITKTLGFLIPKIIPGIAGAIQAVAGAGLRAAGGLALGAAKGLLVGGAKLVAGAVTGAVSAVGLPAIAIGAAVAAAVYGGYKLYKYLNRNEVGKAPFAKLTRLRLLMYGYKDTRKEHYHKLFELEMMMKEFTVNKKGVVTITPLSKKAKEDILGILEVKRDDKAKYEIVNAWFKNRFMPSYVAYMSALSQVRDDVTLETLDKLTNENIFRIASVFRTPTSVFDVLDVPTFEQTKTDVIAKDVEDMLVAIRGASKETLKEDKAEAAVKQEKDKAVENSTAATEDRKSDIQAEKQANADKAQQLPKIQKQVTTPPGESDQAPTSTTISQDTGKQEPGGGGSAPVPPVAAGPLQQGSSSLEGIKPVTNKESILSLEPNVLNLLTGMGKEYKAATGKSIPVNSAARSREAQEKLYRQNPQKAAKPGGSLHEFGLAADIDSKTANELDSLGLMKKYGFTRPIGGETWHIEPAGISLNPAIAKSDPVSRVKRILSSPGRGGSGFGAQPGTPLGRRNMALQEKLFSAGTTQVIDPAKETAKKDVPESPAAPAVQSKTAQTSGTTPTSTAGATPATPASKGQQSTPPTSTQTAQVSPRESMGKGEQVAGERDWEPKPKAISTKDSLSSKESSVAKNTNPLDHKETFVPSRNPNMDMGKVTDDVPTSPEQAVKKAAKVVGVNEQTLMAFGKIESSMRPAAANSQSTAKGMFQFVDGTWQPMVQKYGDMYNIPPDAKPEHPYYSAVMAAAYGKENLKSIGDYKGAGVREDTAMYLGHHFGPSGGRNIVKAHQSSPEAPIANAVSPKAYQSNQQELGNKTVKGYVSYLNNKIDKASGQPSSQTTDQPSGQSPGQAQSGSTPNAVNQQPYKSPTQSPPATSNGASQSSNTAESQQPYTGSSSAKEVRDFQKNSGLYKQDPNTSSTNKPTSTIPPVSPSAADTKPLTQETPRVSPQTKPYNPNPAMYDDEEFIDEQPSTSTPPYSPQQSPTGQPYTPQQPYQSPTTPQPSVYGQPPIDNKPSIYNQPPRASYEAPPMQPNAALSLNKTESLLGNMSGTLLSIKTVLEAIRDKGGMSGPSSGNNPSKQPSEPSGNDQQQPQMDASVSDAIPGSTGGAGGGAQALRVRSNFALSMSRKSQN